MSGTHFKSMNSMDTDEYDVATEMWTALVRSSPGKPTLTHDLTGLDKEKFSQTRIKPCQHAGI